MRAGTLRDRITIQRLSTSLGQWGRDGDWHDLATCFASVRPDSGDERFADSGVTSEVTYTVRLRYRKDLTSADRFIYRGKTLELLSVVDVDGRRRELEVKCKQHEDE